MTEIFKLGDIPIEVEYKRIKKLRMTVYPPDGKVRISAPINTTYDFIQKFAVSKLQWIEKYRERFRRSPRATNSLKNDEILWVWGQTYRLEVIERRGNPKIALDDTNLKLFIRPGDKKEKNQKVLDKWYRRILQETAPPIIDKWESLIGVTVKKLYVRKMKSHWGSCNYTNQTIRLNTELVKKPPECLEYVIIHELIHMLEPSHNRIFYQLMNKYMPSWKIIRKKMNSGEI